MKRLWICTLFLITSLAMVSGQEKTGVVEGYYPAWEWAEHSERLAPAGIPFDRLDALLYCFFYPEESGDLVGVAPAADAALLEPGDGSPSLVERAHQSGTRVVLSLGGWEHSGNFPMVAADPERRARFASACRRLIERYGFDGIDIDWEFPGYKNHNGTPDDRVNFTLLLRTVRDTLDGLEAETGSDYTLSASLPAAASHLVDLQVDRIAAIVDYMTIMTWDLHGSWGAISNHNAALYAPREGDPGRSLDGAFRLYHDTHGVPAEKISMGVPFSGYAYGGVTAMYAEQDREAPTGFATRDAIPYGQIAGEMARFERRWDAAAAAPWYVDAAGKVVVSVDDPESVRLKAEYVQKRGARGLAIWRLMDDRVGGDAFPLLDSLHGALRGPTEN